MILKYRCENCGETYDLENSDGFEPLYLLNDGGEEVELCEPCWKIRMKEMHGRNRKRAGDEEGVEL